MNQKDIIRIAREAGLKVGTNISGVVLVGSPSEIGLAHLTIEEIERFFHAAYAAGVVAEREACAQVCDDRDMGDCNREDMEARACAAAIRERNNP